MRSIKLMFSMAVIGMMTIMACTSEPEQTQEVKKVSFSAAKPVNWQDNKETYEAGTLAEYYVQTGNVTCETCKCNVIAQHGSYVLVNCGGMLNPRLYIVHFDDDGHIISVTYTP